MNTIKDPTLVIIKNTWIRHVKVNTKDHQQNRHTYTGMYQTYMVHNKGSTIIQYLEHIDTSFYTTQKKSKTKQATTIHYLKHLHDSLQNIPKWLIYFTQFCPRPVWKNVCLILNKAVDGHIWNGPVMGPLSLTNDWTSKGRALTEINLLNHLKVETSPINTHLTHKIHTCSYNI